jgi:alginate O-acetyltransferase complex protein AlgI
MMSGDWFSSFDPGKLADIFLFNEDDRLLFNSSFFLLFFSVFLLFYQFFYKRKLTRVLIFTLFSLYFFYKACGWYVSFIVIAAIVDFTLSNWIYKAKTKTGKKSLLIFSVVINLGLLAFFKYTNLFIETLNSISSGNINTLDLVLPIGISFYTFENLSYTIDVYMGHFKPVSSFWDYCFFLSFFPKLVMGPIVRASDFIPQIRKDLSVSSYDISYGLFLILGGLFKKVVISDYIYANFVEFIFNDPSRYTGLECLLGVYGYAMVIYCDFSGYSDMAIGMGRWMGFEININFRTPYQSSNITEFWRRWHISLSSWLRDYLYISLGGNRKGKFRTYVNLMITMLLGGLWHGASWNFVVWGGLHGLALGLDKLKVSLVKEWKSIQNPVGALLWKVGGVLFTFHFVCFCWVFFKCETFSDSGTFLRNIFLNFYPEGFPALWENYRSVFLVMMFGYLVHFVPARFDHWVINRLAPAPLLVKIGVTCLFIWIVIQTKQANPVMPIYLQF